MSGMKRKQGIIFLAMVLILNIAYIGFPVHAAEDIKLSAGSGSGESALIPESEVKQGKTADDYQLAVDDFPNNISSNAATQGESSEYEKDIRVQLKDNNGDYQDEQINDLELRIPLAGEKAELLKKRVYIHDGAQWQEANIDQDKTVDDKLVIKTSVQGPLQVFAPKVIQSGDLELTKVEEVAATIPQSKIPASPQGANANMKLVVADYAEEGAAAADDFKDELKDCEKKFAKSIHVEYDDGTGYEKIQIEGLKLVLPVAGTKDELLDCKVYHYDTINSKWETIAINETKENEIHIVLNSQSPVQVFAPKAPQSGDLELTKVEEVAATIPQSEIPASPQGTNANMKLVVADYAEKGAAADSKFKKDLKNHEKKFAKSIHVEYDDGTGTGYKKIQIKGLELVLPVKGGRDELLNCKVYHYDTINSKWERVAIKEAKDNEIHIVLNSQSPVQVFAPKADKPPKKDTSDKESDNKKNYGRKEDTWKSPFRYRGPLYTSHTQNPVFNLPQKLRQPVPVAYVQPTQGQRWHQSTTAIPVTGESNYLTEILGLSALIAAALVLRKYLTR